MTAPWNSIRRPMIMLAAAAAMSGCAIVEDQIPVQYKAPANISVVPGAELVTVSVNGVDGRVANKDRVSTKKNGYGMEMAKITAANDVVAEVAKSVQSELSSLGFRLGDGSVAIKVETINFYNDFKPGFWTADAVAEVAFNLTARGADGNLVYSRAYKAVGMNNGVGLMVGSAAQPALEQALRDSVQQVVTDQDLHKALLGAASKTQTKPVS